MDSKDKAYGTIKNYESVIIFEPNESNKSNELTKSFDSSDSIDITFCDFTDNKNKLDKNRTCSNESIGYYMICTIS